MNDLLDPIERLERSVRRWRNAALILGAILVSVLTTGFTFFGLAHRENRRALEAAMQQQLIARDQAEAARLQAERALKEAGERKKD
jgi:hypothetical protein